ncbi:MAG TPA: recombinase family protein [Sphingomicrobium sp.]|nr:recombinase family protein [Sphingomicrobium sp.]
MHAQAIAPRPHRCAIYTRKSVDIGLDEELNSLEIQRRICSAFVTSQGHKGWLELPKRYDDAGRSGANLDRPELQALLADIEDGIIDIVVVYKLDRISRTLLDFVRLMDFFERYNIAFVSITQNFDTSDSLGRLILNVLLTFAQFEREIMVDRVRDKKRLVRQSGRWAGGTAPLGYSIRNRVLHPVPSEVPKVRFLFDTFAQCGSYRALRKECRDAGFKGRQYTRKGKKYDGSAPGTSSIKYVLGNPAYVGLVRCGEEIFPGRHPPIIERELFDRVQVLRQKIEDVVKPRRKPALLNKILYDCYGRLMTRHYTTRDDHFRDYYASLQNDWGHRHGQMTLWARADSLERLICVALQDLLANRELVRSGLLRSGCVDHRLERLTERTDSAARRVQGMKSTELGELMRALLVRIELGTDRVKAVVRWREVERYLEWDGIGLFSADESSWGRGTETQLLDIPFETSRGRRTSKESIPDLENANPAPPLVDLILEARRAQAYQDAHPTASLSELGRILHRRNTHLQRLLKLNYLAPDIITAIFAGTQPADLTRGKLSNLDLPLDWALQRRMLGFASDPAWR